MPRLANSTYLLHHDELRADRAGTNTAFILLTPGEQWDLFRYYLPHEPHPAVELLSHRREISSLDPSLPQRAGRALRRLRALQERLPTYRAAEMSRAHPKKNVDKKVTVFSEVRREVKPEEIAKIIWQDYLDQQRRDHQNQQAHDCNAEPNGS